LEIGSKRHDLHLICREIFALAMKHSFVLVPRWRVRSGRIPQFCDDGSKFSDSCDFALSRYWFSRIQSEWDLSYSCDCFSSRSNCRVSRFFSRFHCRDSAGVEAFSMDWNAVVDRHRPNNWIHPPRALANRAIRHLQTCRGRGTLVLPFDRRCQWWPLLLPSSPWVQRCGDVPMRRRLRRADGLLVRGGRFGGAAPLTDGLRLKRGSRDILVVHVDFSGYNFLNTALRTHEAVVRGR